jgi:hypothetical protein
MTVHPHAFARGIVIGLTLSAGVWLAFLLIVWWWVS